jgi:hypothetical protein
MLWSQTGQPRPERLLASAASHFSLLLSFLARGRHRSNGINLLGPLARTPAETLLPSPASQNLSFTQLFSSQRTPILRNQSFSSARPATGPNPLGISGFPVLTFTQLFSSRRTPLNRNQCFGPARQWPGSQVERRLRACPCRCRRNILCLVSIRSLAIRLTIGCGTSFHLVQSAQPKKDDGCRTAYSGPAAQPPKGKAAGNRPRQGPALRRAEPIEVQKSTGTRTASTNPKGAP